MLATKGLFGTKAKTLAQTFGTINRTKNLVSSLNNTFDISGWDSSFTQKDIPEEGMREWVDATVGMIKSYCPKNILEVGSGSGLLLYPLVSNCKSYTGIDFSKNTINKLQTSFEKLSVSRCCRYSLFIQRSFSSLKAPPDFCIFSNENWSINSAIENIS